MPSTSTPDTDPTSNPKTASHHSHSHHSHRHHTTARMLWGTGALVRFHGGATGLYGFLLLTHMTHTSHIHAYLESLMMIVPGRATATASMAQHNSQNTSPCGPRGHVRSHSFIAVNAILRMQLIESYGLYFALLCTRSEAPHETNMHEKGSPGAHMAAA